MLLGFFEEVLFKVRMFFRFVAGVPRLPLGRQRSCSRKKDPGSGFSSFGDGHQTNEHAGKSQLVVGSELDENGNAHPDATN